MKKRILALIMASVMIFGLAACGGNDDAGTNSPSPSQSQPAEQQTPSGGDVSEPAKTETLKIGLLTHQTGWFAGVDAPNYNEFNAMIAYINEDLGGWTVGDTTYISFDKNCAHLL